MPAITRFYKAKIKFTVLADKWNLGEKKNIENLQTGLFINKNWVYN